MALEDKTEAPTERRKEEARKKGQVGRSMELSSSAAIIAALLTMKFTGAGMEEKLSNLFTQSLTQWPVDGFGAAQAVAVGRDTAILMLMVVMPVLLAALLGGSLATVAQVGLVFSGEGLAPQLSRIDPLKGMMRLFSKRSMIELLRSIAKIAVIGYVIWITFKQQSEKLVSLMNADWVTIIGGVGEVAWMLVVRCTIAMIVISAADYYLQHKQHMQELMMTKSELKEDMKRSEGDPTTKGRIRGIMREMARKRMMADVPKADVVVTNPTHIAIALKYDPSRMGAPVVLAKGQRIIAEKIRSIALKHKVPVVQNIPLARSLFKSVEVGQEVPIELYQAVAEILAEVYRLQGKEV